MEENPKQFETLVDRAKDYGQTSLILVTLKALYKSSEVLSSTISNSIGPAIICFAVLFANLGLAFWLGEILGSLNAGFFIVAAFYLVLALFIHIFLRKWMRKCFRNLIIKNVLK
ncbi:MAG: hypothetical protein PHE33_09855 [Bacteroidales bacterium]|nr:hypothetical protein [Bacteroidales bacterium]